MALLNEQKNKWYTLPNQNLAVFMREAGFDLAVYDNYSAAVKKEAKRQAIKVAMNTLEDDFWDETGKFLSEIKHGVYVIRLSGGFSIRYRKEHSPVIYIGEGKVFLRLKQHYNLKLFDFMASLNGVNFDFLICEPWKSYHRGQNFHEQVEHSLLGSFVEKYGGLSDRYCFPLMNKISGSDKGLEVSGSWWEKPLKKSGQKFSWILEPQASSGFLATLD